jgi:hypothetical protein
VSFFQSSAIVGTVPQLYGQCRENSMELARSLRSLARQKERETILQAHFLLQAMENFNRRIRWYEKGQDD